MNLEEERNIWIESEYKLFAENGPTRFSVDELAEILKKSSDMFYLLFKNKDSFIDLILEAHNNLCKHYLK